MKRLIPITALRHLYHQLRDIPKTEFQSTLANELVRLPTYLQSLVRESVAHFELYDNRDEAFRPTSGLLTDARGASEDLANRLVIAINAGRASIQSAPEVQFDFVDYDLSPFRTTGGEFENGRSGSSSGRGGLDLLLSNRTDRLPTIGEVKADTDRNPFLGLIQSLNYAVELSSTSQRVRLQNCYPGRFLWPENGPWIDICLMLIRYPNDAKSCEFLSLTRQLVEKTLVPGTPIGNLVRRVSCLQTLFDQPDQVVFNVSYSHPPAL